MKRTIKEETKKRDPRTALEDDASSSLGPLQTVDETGVRTATAPDTERDDAQKKPAALEGKTAIATESEPQERQQQQQQQQQQDEAIKMQSSSLKRPPLTGSDSAAERHETTDATSDEEGKHAAKSFPEILLEILATPEHEDAIHWSLQGDSFCVGPTQFSKRILPKYFPGTKFESFTRKLNRWGFKRVIDESFHPSSIVYRHDLFQRSQPELLKRMRTAKKKRTRAQQAEKLRSLRQQQHTQQTQLPRNNISGQLPPINQSAAPALPQSLGGLGVQNTLLGQSQIGALGSSLPDATRLQQVLLQQQQAGGTGLPAGISLLQGPHTERLLAARRLQEFGTGDARLDLIDQQAIHNNADALLLRARLQQQLLQERNTQYQGQAVANMVRENQLLQRLQQQEAAAASETAALGLRLLQQSAAGQMPLLDQLSSSLQQSSNSLPSVDLDSQLSLLSRLPSAAAANNSTSAATGGSSLLPSAASALAQQQQPQWHEQQQQQQQQQDSNVLLQLYLLRERQKEERLARRFPP